MHERFELHDPDLAARDRRSGFFNIGSEHDRAGWPPGSPHNDVVIRIRIEKDIDAIEGIQSAVHAIERCAKAVGEADIGNVCSGHRGDAERITTRIAHRPRIATQGRRRDGTCPKRGQPGREDRGQGRHQNVIVVSVSRGACRGGTVLQPGCFVQRNVHTGRQDDRSAGRDGDGRNV
ncbi:hypothetical protein D3C84_777160 [compost metagenome]